MKKSVVDYENTHGIIKNPRQDFNGPYWVARSQNAAFHAVGQQAANMGGTTTNSVFYARFPIFKQSRVYSVGFAGSLKPTTGTAVLDFKAGLCGAGAGMTYPPTDLLAGTARGSGTFNYTSTGSSLQLFKVDLLVPTIVQANTMLWVIWSYTITGTYTGTPTFRSFTATNLLGSVNDNVNNNFTSGAKDVKSTDVQTYSTLDLLGFTAGLAWPPTNGAGSFTSLGAGTDPGNADLGLYLEEV